VQQENVKVTTHVHSLAQMEAEEHRKVAAIPEASTPSRKSKRRAQTMDEHSLDRAERIKAARNLDSNTVKGNNNKTKSSLIHLSNECVTKNLQSIGISLGTCCDQINLSVQRIKEVEAEHALEAKNKDIISEVFDKEEKEELENEEIDKLILNSLCFEIVDE
jgi:hypothetical protein